MVLIVLVLVLKMVVVGMVVMVLVVVMMMMMMRRMLILIKITGALHASGWVHVIYVANVSICFLLLGSFPDSDLDNDEDVDHDDTGNGDEDEDEENTKNDDNAIDTLIQDLFLLMIVMITMIAMIVKLMMMMVMMRNVSPLLLMGCIPVYWLWLVHAVNAQIAKQHHPP